MIYRTYDNLMLNGRLGNQLWQIASTIGLAGLHDEARFKPGWEYREFFSFPEIYFSPVPPGADKIDGGTNYFQEFHYFQEFEDLIRAWTLPSASAAEELRVVRPEFFEPGHKTAIHIRRGDYLNHPRHFPIVTPDYLRRSIQYVLDKTPNTSFYVFSDDPPWCRSFFNSDYHIIEGVPRPVEVSHRRGRPQDQWDLFAMSMCDQHITSNSTFSWWAAFMSQNKSPLYPSVWFGPDLRNIPWKLMIPEGWVEIECL